MLRAAPVAAALLLVGLALLGVCVLSIAFPWDCATPDWDRWYRIWLKSGVLTAQKWVDRPWQTNAPDGWYVGWDWFHLAYVGTYQPAGTINLHGVYYQATLPLWPVGGFIVLLCVMRLRRVARRLRWHHRGCCARCGYDLTGNVSGICSECGRVTPGQRGSEGNQCGDAEF